MTINLPSSPAIGDTLTVGGFTFEWDGSVWNKVAMAGVVRTVNGIGPSATGNVPVSLTSVNTGTLAARPLVATEGDVYVVASDPTLSNNGLTFIWSGTGTWEQIGSASIASNDARYVLKAGDTGMTGNFTITRSNGRMQLDGLGVQIDSIPAGASADLLADELVIRETGVGRTEVNAGNIELTDDAGAASIPTLPEHATTKAYADQQDALRVLKAGDTMTGPLVLPADPTLALQAATKQYVDSRVGTGGGNAGVWRQNWDAAANSPLLADPPPGPPTLNNGDYYLVTTQATRFGQNWQVGDKIVQVAGMTAGSYAWYRIPAEQDQPDNMNVWVSSVVGNNANAGTITRQKQTINSALMVVNAAGGNIRVGAGSYSDNISLSGASVGIEGVGGLPRPQTILSGPITAVGGFPRFRNFELTGVMNLNAVNGTSIVEGVSFSGPGASLSGNNGAGGTIYITDCDFTRATVQTPMQFFNGNGTVYLSNVLGARIAIGPGWTVYVKDCPDIHIRAQGGGSFIFQDAGPAKVDGVLVSDAEVTTLLGTGADGLYSVNYPNPVNANIPDLEQGCVLIVKTWSFGRMVTVHRPAAFAPASFFHGASTYNRYQTGYQIFTSSYIAPDMRSGTADISLPSAAESPYTGTNFRKMTYDTQVSGYSPLGFITHNATTGDFTFTGTTPIVLEIRAQITFTFVTGGNRAIWIGKTGDVVRHGLHVTANTTGWGPSLETTAMLTLNPGDTFFVAAWTNTACTAMGSTSMPQHPRSIQISVVNYNATLPANSGVIRPYLLLERTTNQSVTANVNAEIAFDTIRNNTLPGITLQASNAGFRNTSGLSMQLMLSARWNTQWASATGESSAWLSHRNSAGVEIGRLGWTRFFPNPPGSLIGFSLNDTLVLGSNEFIVPIMFSQLASTVLGNFPAGYPRLMVTELGRG